MAAPRGDARDGDDLWQSKGPDGPGACVLAIDPGVVNTTGIAVVELAPPHKLRHLDRVQGRFDGTSSSTGPFRVVDFIGYLQALIDVHNVRRIVVEKQFMRPGLVLIQGVCAGLAASLYLDFKIWDWKIVTGNEKNKFWGIHSNSHHGNKKAAVKLFLEQVGKVDGTEIRDRFAKLDDVADAYLYAVMEARLSADGGIRSPPTGAHASSSGLIKKAPGDDLGFEEVSWEDGFDSE